MKTVTGVAATRPISLYTDCIARLLPTMAKPLVCAGPTSADSDINRELFTAAPTTSSNSSTSNGFVRYSHAPSFVASIAVSVVPCAVMSTMGSFGFAACNFATSSSPLKPGSLKSVSTRS
jgi:hypothetical protein